MPVTLLQAALNTQDDLDGAIIDEFRKQSGILDSLLFDDAVNPMGGGSTLTYGYHRHVTERDAAFRAINSEYEREKAEKARFTVDLKPLGGKFGIDRVLAQIARGREVSYQLAQLVKATRARFTHELIHGDVDVSANGFDGLDKALTGSSTEVQAADVAGGGDWTNLDANGGVWHNALDAIDEFFSVLDGGPTVVIGNARAVAKFRAIARRANQYVERPVDNLTDGVGAPVVRGYYGNTLLVDAGEQPGSASPIIPVVDGFTDLYAYRVGIDGFHGVSVAEQELLRTFGLGQVNSTEVSGAVQDVEVEMGPVAVALKATKAAAVLRGLEVGGPGVASS